MTKLLSEPYFSLTTSILFFLLALTGSIFMWVLRYPFGDANNLQYGHLLSDEVRPVAVRNLLIASVFYGLMAVLMAYQLILHFKKNRQQSWDPAIAMVNVHTPKGPKRPSSALPGAGDSSIHLSAAESKADLRTGRFRGPTAHPVSFDSKSPK